MQGETKWVTKMMGMPPKPGSKVTLLLFGHAGGTPADYRKWDQLFGPSVKAMPICLPGRGARTSEAPMTDVPRIVSQLVPELLRALGPTRPYALLGQSFGSLLAFETAKALTRSGRPPVALIASARRAPHLVDPSPGEVAISTLDDAGIAKALAERYNDPTLQRIMAEQPDLIRLFMPHIRADMTAFDRYVNPRMDGRPVLSCPVLAVAGESDTRMKDGEEADGWALHTTAVSPKPKRYPGDHFYTRRDDSTALLIKDIEVFLLDVMANPPPQKPQPQPQQPQETKPAETPSLQHQQPKPASVSPPAPNKSPLQQKDDFEDEFTMCF